MYQLTPESHPKPRHLELVSAPEVDLLALVHTIQQAEQDGDCDKRNELFTRFYEHTYSDAYGCAMTYMRNDLGAEDVTQESFERAYSGMNNFRSESSPKTWVYSIVRNVSITALNKQKRVRLLESPYGDADMAELVVSTDPVGDPELQFAADSLGSGLKQALKSLEPIYQKAIELNMNGLTHKEIATKLEITVSNSKIRLMKARRVLKTLLDTQVLV